MALQKPHRKVERKKRVILPNGTFASGKKVGRPRKTETEKITLHLQPDLLQDLKVLATLHCRGNMSEFLRIVLTNALPGLQAISDKANRLSDEKRPHADLVKKQIGRPKKVKSPDEDLGFEVV
jgi:hypothetical protein